MPERIRFEAALVRISPPWLRRNVGAKLLGAFGARIDDLVDRMVDGVKLRFPGHDPTAIDPSALVLLGRERRILRGPNEPDATYAARLQTWWDAHRTRGGPYALMTQLYHFWRATLTPQIDLVYHSGQRYVLSAAGAITRDAITWNADGTAFWSQFWLFFDLPATLDFPLVDDTGQPIVDDLGNQIIATISTGDADGVSAFVDELAAVPREWSAAHVFRITIVLLYGVGRLWDYPVPVPTWTAWAATSTWDQDLPAVVVI